LSKAVTQNQVIRWLWASSHGVLEMSAHCSYTTYQYLCR